LLNTHVENVWNGLVIVQLGKSPWLHLKVIVVGWSRLLEGSADVAYHFIYFSILKIKLAKLPVTNLQKNLKKIKF